MHIRFWGGAQEVTGSKHLLEINNKRVLLDCGFFQGHRQEAEKKNRELPFDAASIDAVLLSHAHMDHVGSLPTLYKLGFRGTVYATNATCDVARVMLEDSAEIQMSDAAYLNRHAANGEKIEPLYTQDDVAAVLGLFETVSYNTPIRIIEGLTARYIEAGHILGSAQIHLTLEERGVHRTLGFTGDLGRKGLPILKDPAFFDQLDYLISESTYGNRLHEPLAEIEQKVQEVVLQAVARNGKVIVPAFALGRTQSLIYVLHKLTDEGKIPRIPIYIDSPMATELTEVFTKHEDVYDAEIRKLFTDEQDPFAFRNLHFTPQADDSKKLNTQKGPFIVIATAGMAEVGRIRHHLKNSIERPNNIILIVGFMAKNTLGRKIVEHESPVRIFDHKYVIRAQVKKINGFSAHADQTELLSHIERIDGLKKIFFVHGEPEGMSVLHDKVHTVKPDIELFMPQMGDGFDL